MNNKYKYSFSIIMSIYNVENYLEEAIESVINQDIGFEKNVQLILINDGSLDNSEEICLRYKNLYPNNIVYKKKKNGGLASAKNKGLKYIEGKYINFFDADDTLPNNTFSEVYRYFKRNGICVDFVAIPLVFFGAQSGLHPKYKYMGKKNKIIDLRAEPYNFVLSSASCFYKHEIFDNFNFDETYFGEEDTLLNFSIFLKNPRFGYVCEKNVQYNYRKRADQNSIVDTAKLNPESFKTVARLLNSVISQNKPINRYEQELIIYELRSRIKTINEELFQSNEDYNNLLKQYKKYIKLLDADFIVNYSKFCETMAQKKVFLMLGEFDNSVLYSKVLTGTDVTVQRFNIQEDKIYMDISFYNYGLSSLDVVVMQNGKMVTATDSNDFDSALNDEIGSISADTSHVRKFVFDIKNRMELKLILFDYNSEQYFPVRKVKMGNKVFANLFNKIYYYKNYKIVFKGRKTTVKKIKNIKLSAFKSNLYGFLRIVKHGKYCAFTRFFSKLDKKYILINDRLDKAGDNGEALFKYINKYEPKLAKNTFYVISSDCKDYNRLKKYGKVVKTGSLKHRILFLNAAFIYSSHTMFEFYSAFDRKVLGYYRDLLKYKFVWLQHGITQNDISRAANRYIKGIDYITTCTNAEHKEFLQDKYCFEESQVILTGFARYDFLENDPKNIIAIAPTWRRGYGLSEGKRDDFIDTAYYKNYSNLLTNKKLLDALTDNNLIIKFFLHPEMANYFDDFKKLESSNVKVIDTKDINYSKIFSESSLFITDYSSTFFDFAYLEKPEIFFQFDIDEFYKTHYKKGYFNHKKDAFGDVIENPKALVDKILFYIDNGFVMEKKYQNIVRKTFAYHDTNNSKRIIEQTYIKEME